RVSHPLSEESGGPEYSRNLSIFSPLPRRAMAFVPAVSQRKQDHRLSRFATGLDVRIGASSSPRAPQVRRGGRPRSPKSDLELEPTLVGRDPPHWPESALRARSLASLIVRFRPASGPRRPGAARRRRPPPPWLPLDGVTPPGWPTSVCGARALLLAKNQPSR
ncbi:hypothetical protein PVAP13_2KG588150, partial [Panicum virgatum]